MKSINLGLRFLLELCTWAAPAFWAWYNLEAWPKYLLIFLGPLSFMLVWAIFNVPNDPSRGGKAPIIVAGKIRLGIEMLQFCAAAVLYFNLGYHQFTLVFVLALILHHILLKDRLIWIWKQ
ncbi:MAG: YrdB family protein [Croceimicrobium sp.]